LQIYTLFEVGAVVEFSKKGGKTYFHYW